MRWGKVRGCKCRAFLVLTRTPRVKTLMDTNRRCDRDAVTMEHYYHHHHHHQVRVAGEVRRVVAPPCPRSTARLQRSPVGRAESFRSWSSHLFRDDQVGDATCGQEVGWVIRSCGAEEPCLPVWRRQVEPHAQLPRCVDGIGDGTVKSDRSVVVLHHFGLGRTIGFQAETQEQWNGTSQSPVCTELSLWWTDDIRLGTRPSGCWDDWIERVLSAIGDDKVRPNEHSVRFGHSIWYDTKRDAILTCKQKLT